MKTALLTKMKLQSQVINIMQSLISMLILLGGAAGIDAWTSNLEAQTRSQFHQAASFLWGSSIGELFIIGLSVFFFWIFTCKKKSNKIGIALFLFVGAIPLFYNNVAYYVDFFDASSRLLPGTSLFTVSAFIFITGAFNLLRQYRVRQ